VTVTDPYAKLTEHALGVLSEAAKRELYRVPLASPAAVVWTCRLGTVNQTPPGLIRRGYITRHATIPWLPSIDPRYRNRAVGPVDVYRLTAAGWAAARRQLTSADTRALLGEVPA
jgi:hypothetical protein